MAQTKSIVSSRFPYLPIHVVVNKNSYDLTALVDTGFDGEVVLPSMFVSNGESPRRFLTCRLADNSLIEAPSYIGSVKLGDKMLRNIVVVIMGDEPIIGRGIILHFNIILDHGRRIIIEF